MEANAERSLPPGVRVAAPGRSGDVLPRLSKTGDVCVLPDPEMDKRILE